MNKNNIAFNKLKQELGTEELADAVMLPEFLGESKEDQIHQTFLKLRMDRKESMTEMEQLLSGLLNFKYNLKHSILQNDSNFKFGKWLISYIKLVGRNQKEFANEIGLHPSRLNRIIKGKEKTGKSIAYRLENHSGDTIPAILWWRAMQKEVELEILTGEKAREIEKKFVRNVAYRG